MTSTAFKRVLTPGVLYLGDNGRCFCGKAGCGGASVEFTGRDLSGQRVETLTVADVIETNAMMGEMGGNAGLRLTCERCGFSPVPE